MTVMLFKDYWSMLYKKILFQSFYFKISRLIHCELFVKIVLKTVLHQIVLVIMQWNLTWTSPSMTPSRWMRSSLERSISCALLCCISRGFWGFCKVPETAFSSLLSFSSRALLFFFISSCLLLSFSVLWILASGFSGLFSGPSISLLLDLIFTCRCKPRWTSSTDTPETISWKYHTVRTIKHLIAVSTLRIVFFLCICVLFSSTNI